MNNKEPIISYGKSDDAWLGYKNFIISQIRSGEIKNVYEIGGGANPQLDTNTISVIKSSNTEDSMGILIITKR